MSFGEPIFLMFFLPFLLACYYLLPRCFRNSILLVASLLFYSWGEPAYVWLMLTSICFNWLCGLWIGIRQGNPSRLPVIVAVVGNLWILGANKYAGFLVETVNALAGGLGFPVMAVPEIKLPIGVSFYTFQALSYVVDVWRKDAGVERNPFRFALYVALFPQLVAGPIVRYRDVARQLVSRRESCDGFAYGIRRFILGLGKKLIIADTLAYYADLVFACGLSSPPPSVAWLGLACYTLQLYFDFSGYSDMAIGLGHMFGFRFRENFRYPYISGSVTEFWRRWHISLSTWFRDYLYIPLGGNRQGPVRTYRNLVIVFFLCGLWHGASWNFVLWGLYHGLFLVLERVVRHYSRWQVPFPLRWLYMILVVMIGWVFFRTESLGEALIFLRALIGWDGVNPVFCDPELYIDREWIVALLIAIAWATSLMCQIGRQFKRVQAGSTGSRRNVLVALRGLWSTVGLGLILVYCIMTMAAGSYSPFIYFRF